MVIIKTFIIAVFALGCLNSSFAQSDSCNYSVSGIVLDLDTEEPIPFVNVNVVGTKKAVHTDVNGRFHIKGLCQKDNTLLVSCYGYANSVCEHGHHEHGNSPHIYLKQEVLEFGPVIINAGKQKEEGTNSIAQATVKKEEIKRDPTKSLASLISDKDGVTMISAGSNVQLPVIHGLYGNRVLVLNKGLKHGFQNWGSDHAPEIDISSAHAVTVIKGATGVRFGPEALGGTVIVEPNPLYLRNPFYVEVGTGFQTNGRGFHTTLETGNGFKKWSYFLNAGFTKIGDRHAPDYSLTNSGKEERSIDFGTRYRHKKWDFKVYYSYLHQNLALLRSSIAESGNAFVYAINSAEPTFIRPFSYAINQPNQLTQHQMGKAEINWRYSERAKLTFTTGIQLNQREEYDVRRDVELPIIDLDLLTTDYQLTWKHPDWWKLDGLLGVQYFTQLNDNNPGTQTTPFIPNYASTRYSAFLTETKRFNRNTIEAGVRVDYEFNAVAGRQTNQEVFRDDFSFTNATASIGYVRGFSKNSSFRTNLGTAWRTPNMAELFSFGQHHFKSSFGLLRYYTNESGELRTDRVIPLRESSVMPERGYKFINELQIVRKKSEHTLTAYSHYIENFIFDRPIAVIGTIRGPMPVFIYDQADAFFAGVDYSWRMNWSKKVSGVARMNYLWSWNISKNETLINQPPAAVSYKLTWNQGEFWIFESSEWSIKPRYTFTQFQAPRTISPEDLIDGVVELTPDSEIFDFKDAPDGYFLLDLSWHFKWKNFNAGVTVSNVLNTSYRDYLNEMRYFADEPGMNVLFTLNYLFKNKKKN